MILDFPQVISPAKRKIFFSGGIQFNERPDLEPLFGDDLKESMQMEALPLNQQVAGLDSRVKALEQKHRSEEIHVTLTDLSPLEFSLKKHIPVVITGNDEDGFVATFFDAEMVASGDTPVEATSNLKDMICAQYEFFDSNEASLAQWLKQQLLVLRQFIVRHG